LAITGMLLDGGEGVDMSLTVTTGRDEASIDIGNDLSPYIESEKEEKKRSLEMNAENPTLKLTFYRHQSVGAGAWVKQVHQSGAQAGGECRRCDDIKT